MRINWKLLAGFSLFGGVISLISGIAGGNPFGVILLRLLLSAVAFGALGLGVQSLLGRYLPELLKAAPPARQGTGDSIDIIIDDELPGVGEVEEAREVEEGREAEAMPAEAAETSVSWEAFPEPDGGAPEGGAPEGGIGAEPEEGPAEEGEVELLPEFDELEPEGSPAEPGIFEESAGDEAQEPVRKTPSTPREMRQAQIEETVKGQDPEDLAKAVRTFLKKDQ